MRIRFIISHILQHPIINLATELQTCQKAPKVFFRILAKGRLIHWPPLKAILLSSKKDFKSE